MNIGEILAGVIIIAVIGAAAVIAAGYYTFFFSFFPDNQILATVATLIVFACIILFIRNSGHEFFGFVNKGRDERAIPARHHRVPREFREPTESGVYRRTIWAPPI